MNEPQLAQEPMFLRGVEDNPKAERLSPPHREREITRR
jgi:hypothetical protein